MAEKPEDELPPTGGEDTQPAPEGGADTTPEAEQALSVDDLARDLGWKPEEEWKGSKDNWTPAADFLRGKVTKSERLSSEIRDVRDTVNRISRTTAAITDRAVAEERERLAQRFSEATEAGDTQAAWKAAQDLQRTEPARQGADEFDAWRAKNTWYDADPEARAYAIGLGEVHKGKPFEEAAKAVDAAMRKRFPEHFEEDQPPAERERQRTPLVSGPTTRSARPMPRQKSEADLPPEARRAAEDFVRRGRVGSLAEYAKIYFEENA